MSCNYCGGLMRNFQSSVPSCILCGRENKRIGCPFCNSDGLIFETKSKVQTEWYNGSSEKEVLRYDIKCSNPTCFLGKKHRFETKELAWEAWGMRYKDESMQKTSDGLFDEGFLKGFKKENVLYDEMLKD